MELLSMWLLTALATAIPLAALALRRINPSEDYFFSFIYAQALVYLHLAPTLWASEISDLKVRSLYVYLQFACICFFELPFIWVYLRLRKRSLQGESARILLWALKRRSYWWLGTLCFVFAVSFLMIATSQGVFFTRLGEQEKLLAFLSLGLVQFGVYRLFQLSAPFLVCILLAARFTSKGSRGRAVMWTFTLCTAAIYFVQALVNSREDSLIFLSLIVGMLVFLSGEDRFLRKVVFLTVLGVVGAAYILKVSEGFRQAYAEQGRIEWRLLNPLAYTSGPEDTDLRLRLNGVDLMAEMTPAAQREGFAMGDAWRGLVIVTLFQYMQSKIAAEYKESYLGSPKAYLIARYTDLGRVDYFSCILTDAYGNFGFWGFPAVALVLAWCCAFATGNISRPETPRSFIIGVFIAVHIMSFDQQFGDLLFGWVKELPVLICVFLLSPWETSRFLHRRRRSDAGRMLLRTEGA